MHIIFIRLRRLGRLWEFKFKASWGHRIPTRGPFSTTFSFLLILALHSSAPCGFLMLFLSPSPVCRLAPFSLMHVLFLVLDPDPLATYGSRFILDVMLALRLLVHSPLKLSNAPIFVHPFPSKPCLVFKCRSSVLSAITPHRPSFLRFRLLIIAKANFGSSALQIYGHREPLNSILLHCSNLQPNTFCSFDGILLFPSFSNYFWDITWSPVVSCSGVIACLTGSSVQQSRPP